MRKVLLAILVVLALAVAPAVEAKGRPPAKVTTDRGIVLRVRINGLQLRELDGSVRYFRVGPSTVVTLDGHAAAILDLQRGDVAYVDRFGNGNGEAAFRIRAFTR